MHVCHSIGLGSVITSRLCVHSSYMRHRIGLAKVAGHRGSRRALGGIAHRRPKSARVKRCAGVDESFRGRRFVGVSVVRRFLRRRGSGPDVVQPRSRRVARRQWNAADDWVRFKTPACRTSCIMRSFSWRTANKHNSSLILCHAGGGGGNCWDWGYGLKFWWAKTDIPVAVSL